MIRQVAKALVAVVGLTAIVSVAAADIPDPNPSIIDGPLMIGSARGGAILSAPNLVETICDGYQVVLLDAFRNPVAGATATLEFAGTGITVHSTQTGGQVANCQANTLSGVTDAQGRVVFFPATVGENTSAVPNVQIRAFGVLIATVRIPSMDLVSVGPGMPSSVNVADLNEFRLRFLNQAPHSNRDPECDYATLGASAGVVDAWDLNVFRSEFLCGLDGGAPAPCSQTECP